jgi:hypothetical protein
MQQKPAHVIGELVDIAMLPAQSGGLNPRFPKRRPNINTLTPEFVYIIPPAPR